MIQNSFLATQRRVFVCILCKAGVATHPIPFKYHKADSSIGKGSMLCGSQDERTLLGAKSILGMYNIIAY